MAWCGHIVEDIATKNSGHDVYGARQHCSLKARKSPQIRSIDRVSRCCTAITGVSVQIASTSYTQ